MFKSRLIGFVILIIIFVYFWKHTGSIPWNDLSFKKNRTAAPRPVAVTPSEPGSDEKTTIKIFEQSAPSVITIINSALVKGTFSLNVLEIPEGVGSGFLWDDKGHIVTNSHVLYGGDTFEVIQSGRGSYKAQVVGIAPEYDLAVLRVRALKGTVAPLPIGTSSDLQVGQKVLAIGNPFGLDRTLITGVISAIGRSITSLTGAVMIDLIQTDAAINPGCSGGPLLDSFGRVIGISIAINSPDGANAGVGIAVPVDTINRVVPQLISRGKAERPGLGITLLPDTVRKHLGITGAVIYDVAPDGAAQSALLKGIHKNETGELVPGDSIVSVNDTPVSNNEDLLKTIAQYQVGETVTVEYLRNNKKQHTEITLQAL